jgi:Protein of unknown function (DUF3574)
MKVAPKSETRNIMVQSGRLRAFASFTLALGLLIGATPSAAQEITTPQEQQPVVQRRMGEAARAGGQPFARTELFFGTAKPDGVVTEDEFRSFIDEEVTPRFPDGLTLLKGDGQFRGSDGVLVKEQSFVLILLYASDTYTDSSRRIERIRRLYTKRFQQESVLRVDDPFAVWVSF